MEIRYLGLDEVVVDRENRQRKALDVSDLVDSIQQNEELLPDTFGLLQPIVVRNGFTLVAGERRFEAFRQLGRDKIPVINIEDLDEDSAYLLELEENLKRKSLTWQETVIAVSTIHERWVGLDSEWTQAQTAARLGIPATQVSQCLNVAEYLPTDREVQLATTLSTANTIIKNRASRELDDMATTIGFTLRNMFSNTPLAEKAKTLVDTVKKTPVAQVLTNSLQGIHLPTNLIAGRPITVAKPEPKQLSGEASLLNGDFVEWVDTYKGPRFNLIHCDFPYIAGASRKGSQIHAGGEGRVYEDNEDVFWQLCEALCIGMDNVIAGSAHIVFWYQTSRFQEVFNYWQSMSKKYNLTVFDVPLIWHKSDGSGVVSDTGRRYRHVYENALLLSRGDRKIIRTVADVYSAPISRDIHPSEKPEPMLREFFRALVSNTTRLLDPTAGSASALRAAESLGAEFVFGIEKDEKFYKESVEALDRFRRKKALEALAQKKETTE